MFIIVELSVDYRLDTCQIILASPVRTFDEGDWADTDYERQEWDVRAGCIRISREAILTIAATVDRGVFWHPYLEVIFVWACKPIWKSWYCSYDLSNIVIDLDILQKLRVFWNILNCEWRSTRLAVRSQGLPVEIQCLVAFFFEFQEVTVAVLSDEGWIDALDLALDDTGNITC
jgi:hypothetical protein